MRTALSTFLFFCCAGVALGAQGADEAKRVASDYIRQWQKGKICQAIDKHWNFGELLAGIAGKDYGQLSKEDQNHLRSVASMQFKTAQGLPGVQAAISRATFAFKAVRKLPDGTYQCDLDVAFQPGQTVRNAIVLKKVADQWKIIDVLHRGRGLISQLSPLYKRIKAEGVSLTTWYETMLFQTLQRKLGAGKPR